MTSRPILFSRPMVQAILAGEKTQTRRPIAHPFFVIGERDDGSPWPLAPQMDEGDGTAPWIACPYGRPGDRLWVREAFSPRDSNGDACRIDEAAYAVLSDGTQVHRDGVVVPALGEYAPGAFDGIKWRPSIHMPRWASRIELEVVGVRVERLHSISDADILAEGVTIELAAELVGMPRAFVGNSFDAWRLLWTAINGDASWDRNPWVWVVEFRWRRRSKAERRDGR